MTSLSEILTRLHSLADPYSLPRMAKFGVNTEDRLGVRVPDLRKLAKEIGTDHQLALELWDSAVPEARLLATMVADPALITPRQMDAWARDLNSWDICDSACDNLFVFSPHAWDKVAPWAADEREFVRRAGYVLPPVASPGGLRVSRRAGYVLPPVVCTGGIEGGRLVALQTVSSFKPTTRTAVASR